MALAIDRPKHHWISQSQAYGKAYGQVYSHSHINKELLVLSTAALAFSIRTRSRHLNGMVQVRIRIGFRTGANRIRTNRVGDNRVETNRAGAQQG